MGKNLCDLIKSMPPLICAHYSTLVMLNPFNLTNMDLFMKLSQPYREGTGVAGQPKF